MQAGVPQRDKREDKRRDKQLADCCQDARLLLSCGVWSRDGDCGCLVEYGVEMGNDAQGTPLCAGHMRSARSFSRPARTGRRVTAWSTSRQSRALSTHTCMTYQHRCGTSTSRVQHQQQSPAHQVRCKTNRKLLQHNRTD